MAQISSTFSSSYAGRLKITLSGLFYQGPKNTPGIQPGSGDYYLCATVNGVQTANINRSTPSVYAEMDYPGGNAVWNVSTTTIATTDGNKYTADNYGFTNLKIIIELLKK